MELIDCVIRFADAIGTTPDDALSALIGFSSIFVVLRAVVNAVIVYAILELLFWLRKRRQKKP